MVSKILLIVYIITIIWAVFDWCSCIIKLEQWRKDHNLNPIKYSVFERISAIFKIIVFIIIPILNVIISTVVISDAVFEKSKKQILAANNNTKL